MNQHTLLTAQTSQVIKHVRSEATEESLQIFTGELIKHVTKNIMDNLIFNIDKMGFLIITIQEGLLLSLAQKMFCQKV